MRRIGAHVPNAHPLQEAASRQIDVIQVFLSNPQGWRPPEPRPDAAELAGSTLDIYVHAPYLVNLVAENNRVRIPSRKILQETCDAAASIGARAVVVHGGHVTDGPLEDAWPRWRKALEQLDSTVPVLIENTASGDRAAARRVDDLARLWQEIGDLGPGLVLDTCHAWAGGEPLDDLVERVISATGRIDLIHANDAHHLHGVAEKLPAQGERVVRLIQPPEFRFTRLLADRQRTGCVNYWHHRATAIEQYRKVLPGQHPNGAAIVFS